MLIVVKCSYHVLFGLLTTVKPDGGTGSLKNTSKASQAGQKCMVGQIYWPMGCYVGHPQCRHSRCW